MIDVHIGFMDEEVSELLRYLIEYFRKDRPVIAIERGKVATDDFLFETPFYNYVGNNKESLKIIPVERTMARSPIEKYPGDDAPLENRLAHYLYNEMYGDGDFIGEKIRGKVLQAASVKSTSVETPFSVIRFNPILETSKDPIILIRNPEMGTQPSIVRPYERAILKAISRLKEALAPSSNKKIDAGIRLYSFASGGAIKPKLKPGSITRPLASLYIGSEVDEQGRLYSVVNLVAIRKVGAHYSLLPQHVELFRYETLCTYMSSDPAEIIPDELEAANNRATKLAENFVLGGDELLSATLECLSECYNEGFRYEPIISSDGEELNAGAPEITASFSYFDELKTKEELSEEFNNIVVNSNMEDYHVLRLARSMRERGGDIYEKGSAPHKYANLIDVDILRVNANVNIPFDRMRQYIESYLSGIRLTKTDYIESIMWGLTGCPIKFVGGLPRTVKHWRLYEELQKSSNNSDLLQYVYTYKNGEDIYCMDPFCSEIATDLLKELVIPKNKFPEKLQGAAKEVLQEAKQQTWNGDWAKTFGLVKSLVDIMYHHYADGASESGEETMYCWLRPGKKWNGLNGETKLTKELAATFLNSKENVDRLFYKSANTLALRKLAHIAAQRSRIPN